MILQAIILGIVQGLTEFLPISSSAHLYLLPYFFHWSYEGLGFDVALHWGTLLAILAIFWRDYYVAVFKDRRMLWYLIIGTIPGAAAGYFLEKQAETVFRHPLVTVFALAGFGILLWWADRKKRTGEGEGKLSWFKSLFMGVAQAIAIVPGVSRSGITITAGLWSGLSREQAARFSFMLSGPIIFGAGLVAFRELPGISAALIAGFVAAAVSGFLTIKFLLKYLATHDFSIFVWYRLALAGIILLSLIR